MKQRSPILRLHPDQKIEIAMIRRLRQEASELRAGVSQGYYNDDELVRFWRLVENAGVVLFASNTELAERAGVGEKFFSSVARDKRRPKLHNFLRALTALVETADERLLEVSSSAVRTVELDEYRAIPLSQIQISGDQLLTLSSSLAQMARAEIEKLDDERPNDPATIASNVRLRELLSTFAVGFEQISDGLSALAKQPDEPVLLGKAAAAVESLGREVSKWWATNAAEVIDWGTRLPVLTAGVAALGWAGADMTIGTTAVAAIVGGKKVADAIKGLKPNGKSKRSDG